MRQEIVTYQGDGLTLVGQLFDNGAPGQRPGVLLFPDAAGIGEQVLMRAKAIADLGYVALACDYYGDGRLASGMAQAMNWLGPLRENIPGIRARAQAGLAMLRTRPEVDAARVAAIGYCFGGTVAIELARGGADICGVVGFHSGLGAPASGTAKDIKAKMLVCLGADDPLINPEQRLAFEQEMRAGGVDWRMHLYGGVVHGFTNTDADKGGRPDVVRYDAGADARSWAEMRALFDEVF